jgi:uroporphyrinogen-III synthase
LSPEPVPSSPPWRVAVTRDEDGEGPLTRALGAHGFDVVHCPVIAEAPPEDDAPLARAATGLAHYGWAIFASQRSVAAVCRARREPWPRGLRTAAVGAATAQALADAGADPAPLVADEAGAGALWQRLKDADSWSGRRVLVPTTPGGRRELIDKLTHAGALVDEVDAYRTVRRSPGLVAENWRALSPDAVVLASPSAVSALSSAIRPDELRRLAAVVAIGPTTAAALAELGIPALVPPRAGFSDAARCLAAVWRERRSHGAAAGAACYPSGHSS